MFDLYYNDLQNALISLILQFIKYEAEQKHENSGVSDLSL